MNKEWEKYKDFLIKKMPIYANNLGAPAADYEIGELEEELNIKLPKDFVDVYSINNGEIESYNKNNKWGIMCGSKMLSIEEILDYFYWKEKSTKGRKKQIPIFKDIEEDYYIAIDLSSKPNEKNYGQIIGFGIYRETDTILIGSCLTDFFSKVNNYVEEGYLSYSLHLENDNEISVHDIRMYFEHQTIALVRLLVGTYFNYYM